MKTIDTLKQAIADAESVLANAKLELQEFKLSARHNVFETLEEAESVLYNMLREMASDDCEGSYNCGMDEYICEFAVAGVVYNGKLTCEYNRHDKTYYYVESAQFSYAPSPIPI